MGGLPTDTDGDGVIDVIHELEADILLPIDEDCPTCTDELLSGLGSWCLCLAPLPFTTLWNFLDHNDNGCVDACEWACLMSCWEGYGFDFSGISTAGWPDYSAETFEEFDDDGNCCLSRTETFAGVDEIDAFDYFYGPLGGAPGPIELDLERSPILMATPVTPDTPVVPPVIPIGLDDPVTTMADPATITSDAS